MSEHEHTDAGGRVWRFERRTGRKTWVTYIDGVEVLMLSQESHSGWLLHRPWDVDVNTGENTISLAIHKAQQFLGVPTSLPPGAKYIVTTEAVRDAFALTHSALGTAAFDVWLAQHDEEIIASVTSAMNAMRGVS